MLGSGVQARLPLDDAVAPRIDRHEADPGWEVAAEVLPVLGATVAPETRVAHQAIEAGGAEHADPEDRRPYQRMNGELVLERRTEGDDAGDELGPAHRQHAGEAAAAALADDRDLLPALLGKAFESPLEPLGSTLRAVDVDRDAGATRPMARLLQPARHEVHRLIAWEEGGDQHPRLAPPIGYPFPGPGARGDEPGELEPDPAFPPHGRHTGVGKVHGG